MTKPFSGFRRALSFTTSLSLALPLMPVAAQAQVAAAPPSRVGQIADVRGAVSFNGSGSGGWAAAAVNYPVVEGDALYTQDRSRAAIALNASKISLNSDTELQITQLSDSNLAVTESQGEAMFTLNDLQPGQIFTIATPRASVTISQDGQYDVIAGDASNPTIVESLQGAAIVSTNAVTLQVAQGQEAVLTGTDPIQAQLAAAQPGDFASRILAESAPPPPQYVPPLVGQMTGVAELSSYGRWSQDSAYGAVWYPQVSTGWAPYREGHWANIAPWGWTWVEDEPWGFAPFHYGRWFHDHDRWGWAPAPNYSEGGDYGRDDQPVYAPAVVSFFGLGVGVGITAALLATHSVGWVPLAPNEPYYPYYRSSPDYVRRLNIVNVRNINEVNIQNNYYYGDNKNFAYNRLANHTAATVIPGAAMSNGEHVGQAGRPAPENILAAARPIMPHTADHAPNGHPGTYLPPAPRPLAQIRPGVAPHLTEFAQHPPIRPGIVGPPPIASGVNHMTNGANHAAPPPNVADHPNFTAPNPGFHAPPPPPANAAHPGSLPPAQGLHPQMLPQDQSHPQAQPFHPQAAPPPAPQNHPQMQPRVQPPFHPEVAQPQAPQFHPQVEQPHLQAPPLRPQVIQPRPQPPAFHPQVQPPPPPHPQMQMQMQMQQPQPRPQPQIQRPAPPPPPPRPAAPPPRPAPPPQKEDKPQHP